MNEKHYNLINKILNAVYKYEFVDLKNLAQIIDIPLNLLRLIIQYLIKKDCLRIINLNNNQNGIKCSFCSYCNNHNLPKIFYISEKGKKIILK
ncbi:MAG: hypothetical protein ACTSQP_21170 [Promethearchaeota archaeon]